MWPGQWDGKFQQGCRTGPGPWRASEPAALGLPPGMASQYNRCVEAAIRLRGAGGSCDAPKANAPAGAPHRLTRPHNRVFWRAGAFARHSSATSAGRPSKSGTCEMAETQLGLRDSSRLGHSAGYRPHPDPSQTAFRGCKEPMSDIWRWPVLKLKMAIRSRQRTTISTPNIISDRCAPNRHNKRRLTRRDRPQPIRGAPKACARLRIDLESNRAQCAGSAPFGRFKRGRIKR